MNAIVALCHFCEMHGPSVLFCTQSFHDGDDPQKVFANTSMMKSVLEEDAINTKRYYGKLENFQRSSSVSSYSGVASGSTDEHVAISSRSSSAKASDTCEACRSIPIGQSGFISNDHEAKVSYVSSQYPFHPEIFSIVRQACVRSLSCEVCPGREGPIFFGDEHRGHVLSHTFFLKDSQARGFHRWYSIIIVMMDKIFLLNSWPFLVKHLRTVIDELQEKAAKLYQVEQADCPQRVVRLNSVTSMTPGNFRRQRGSSKSMRSLDDLTNDKDVFAGLHLWFTWILKACGNRLTEKLLEGPLTEDTVIDLEKQEETEEGFMLVNTKKVPIESYDQASSMGELQVVKAADNLSSASAKISSVRDLWKIIGREKFHILAYHTVIGNQVIILSDDKEISSAIIRSLMILLPKGCVHAILYSSSYVDSWKCNLLSLPKAAFLPDHVRNSELHIVVQVSSFENSGPEDFLNYGVNLSSSLAVPDKGPTILQRMEKIIENQEFSERVVAVYFMTLKEEWMNKVKVLFKFSRTGSRTVEDTLKLLQVLGAHERDKQVLKFWMTGLSVQYKTNILSATMTQCHGNEGAVS